jgi:hypothetical protein
MKEGIELMTLDHAKSGGYCQVSTWMSTVGGMALCVEEVKRLKELGIVARVIVRSKYGKKQVAVWRKPRHE